MLPLTKRPRYITTEDQKEGVEFLPSIGYNGFKFVVHSMNDLDGGYGALPHEVVGHGGVGITNADEWRSPEKLLRDPAYGGAFNNYNGMQYDLLACIDCF